MNQIEKLMFETLVEIEAIMTEDGEIEQNPWIPGCRARPTLAMIRETLKVVREDQGVETGNQKIRKV